MSLHKAYIDHPAFSFWQDSDHFCMNTDTVLLAHFIHPKKGDRVLEIGCNNGALLVWMDQYDIESLYGMEILEEPANLARKNTEALNHPCTIENCDVRRTEQTDEFDLILCNPPFFPDQASLPENLTLRQLGRVEKNLNVQELIQCSARLLKSNGRLCLVHRPNRLQEIILLLNQYHFGLSRLQIAYDHRDNQAKAILIEAIRDQSPETWIDSPAWIGR